MALFGPRFDLEAGEAVPAAWTGSLQPGPPPVLRHRAQASQRFIVGKTCSSVCRLDHLERPQMSFEVCLKGPARISVT